MMLRPTHFGASVLLLVLQTLGAPRALAQSVKQIPPPGIAVPPADRKELEAGVAELGQRIDGLRETLKHKPQLLELLPDVQIFHNAARYALKYNEFFDAGQVAQARALLREGMERADALAQGHAPWSTVPDLVVRGYVSKIDGSVQPYGLVVPESFAADPQRPRRLDIWYHGRGETLNEINFLTDRQRSRGEFAPEDTIVLHPYGRYCNANRFAGEVDTFEALQSVKSHYAIDDDRISVRGFSMGGAACWMFATHHAGLWAAAAPGAGFSETAGFLHIGDLESVPSYQRKLWHWYDSTDYALNLFNCPTVAYSGGIDPQKQAADAMAKALSDVGMELVHIIGPNTRHQYEPNAKREVARRIDLLARHGRNPAPWHVKLTTWTLRYNQMLWVQVDALEHHWERATVDAKIMHPTEVQVATTGVAALTLSFEPGYCPLDQNHEPRVTIDHQELTAPRPMSDRSWVAHFQRTDGKWAVVQSVDQSTLRKRHGLQGPIDDAFMDSFIFVRPTGPAMNPKTGQWINSEMTRAIDQWRAQFRGEARVKDDTAIDDADIASSNLVLWGDPAGNAVLKRIIDKLPLHWDNQTIHLGNKMWPATTDLAAMIYPNPLNPNRYVVLNSGFTFREYDYQNNARQTAKLPDWAIIDTTEPPSPQAPGKIADAGFFDEKWKAGEEIVN